MEPLTAYTSLVVYCAVFALSVKEGPMGISYKEGGVEKLNRFWKRVLATLVALPFAGLGLAALCWFVGTVFLGMSELAFAPLSILDSALLFLWFRRLVSLAQRRG